VARLRIVRRVLWAVAAGGALAGMVALVLPPGTGDGAAPAVLPPDASVALPAGPAPTTLEDVVIANVFSARRAPPASRYLPPGSGGDSAGGLAGDSAGPADAEAPAGGPVLFGTLVTAAGARALLQLDSSVPGGHLYGVGEGVAGYRVVSITPRAVVLSGPHGRVTLRLDREEEHP
jgi:hypothetical protein